MLLGLELQERERERVYHREIEKSKKLASELSCINDKVSHKVWRKNQQDLVDKESKALEDALDEARYSLLTEQKQVNARMCR